MNISLIWPLFERVNELPLTLSESNPLSSSDALTFYIPSPLTFSDEKNLGVLLELGIEPTLVLVSSKAQIEWTITSQPYHYDESEDDNEE